MKPLKRAPRRTGRITTRVSESLMRKIHAYAQDEQITMSTAVQRILLEWAKARLKK